jgi:hypothetical protein
MSATALSPWTALKCISDKPKDPGIPSNYPFKEQILAEIQTEQRKVFQSPSARGIYAHSQYLDGRAKTEEEGRKSCS